MLSLLELLGLPISGYLTFYATMKFLTLLGHRVERLNPLATGSLDVLREFSGRTPRVLVIIPSYNDRSIDEALPKWFNQEYPNYGVVVAEDGGKSYEAYGELEHAREYDYTLPTGEPQRVVVEKIRLRKTRLESLVVVRRNDRRGFKPGALNNVLYLVKTGVLRDLVGVEEPDYVMIVDADHEPGRNPFLRILLGKKPSPEPLGREEYEALGEKLRPYEEAGRDILGLDSYRLDPVRMDSPDTMITRAVELIEYHRFLDPATAVVQGYQNHLYDPNRGLDLLVHVAHILAQRNLALRTPKVKIEVEDDRGRRVYETREKSRLLRLLGRMLWRRWRKVNEVARNGRRLRVYVSNHGFPLFTGSSGIIRYDLLSTYMFADGAFNPHLSVTEDWELSIRLQRDGYRIYATHQLETWGRPPEDFEAYRRQQYRWAYGTLRDLKTHFRGVVGSGRLGLTEKTGYIAQATHYSGLFNIISIIIFTYYIILSKPPLMAIVPQGLFYYIAYLSDLFLFYSINLFKQLHTKYISISLVHSEAFVRAILNNKLTWLVTKRRNLDLI